MSPAVRIYPSGSRLIAKGERARIMAWHQAEFSHLPIQGRYEWETGHDLDLLLRVNGTLVGSVGLIKRRVRLDGNGATIGGVLGLVIDPAWRRRGLGARLMREAHRAIFERLEADFGFLFCKMDLLGFYGSLGWTALSCPVMVEKGGETVLWSESAMILNKERGFDSASIQSIDIQGKPF
jgi:aminoglycoside 2'-N-acetyltransferase I